MRLTKIRQKFSFKWLKLALPLLAIVALLFIFRYSAALSAAPGYEAIWVTEPSFPAGYVKTGQIILELQPCTYELLGWQEETLYYQSNCQENIQFWQYKEMVTRRVLLAGNGMATQDGEWTAVVSQHVYAPQDVLIVKAQDS